MKQKRKRGSFWKHKSTRLSKRIYKGTYEFSKKLGRTFNLVTKIRGQRKPDLKTYESHEAAKKAGWYKV